AGNDKEDVVVSEEEGHAANPGVPEESVDEPTCTGLLDDKDTHEDKAESSAATVSNMSEDLLDMYLDTFGTTAAICDTPVGTVSAIRNVPVGTGAAICSAHVGTTTAAYHGLPVVSRNMTLAPKRPHPGSKCVDKPATKKVMIDPYEDLTDPSEQELNIILTNYPGRRPAITSGMKKLALALYAKPPDVSSITKLLNVPPHACAPTQPAVPNVVAGCTVTLKDISKAKGRGEAVMNLVQAFEYVLWVAKWEVALRRNYPERKKLFMEMLPVIDIANGQHEGQTIINLNRALVLQACNAKEFDKVVKDMMGGEIVGKAREDFN
ncbi:hypothetical protein IWW46_004498, partial [Coemansia sp. RSA 2440]